MSTALTVLLVWVTASVLVGVGFALGSAIGYRRGFEAADQAGPHTHPEPVWIDVRDLQQVGRGSPVGRGAP